MRHVGVVVNPTAGRGRGARVGRRVHELLTARGTKVEDLSAPTLAQATDRARAAAVRGLDALVVVGGDGIVHLGVNVVAGTGLPLGVVAAGTGNDMARALGLPRGDVDAAVAVVERALHDGPRRVDAVRVGTPEHSAHEWYLGVLSCGIDAAVNARANRLTWPGGSARYVRALAAELAGFRPYGYRVTLDDRTWESPGTLVAIANAPWFGGGLQIAPDARMDDGLLDVVVAGPLSRRAVTGIFPGIYRGRHVHHPAVQVLRARSVLVEPVAAHGAVPPAAFADGERVGPLPLRVQVDPGALAVLA
ncbi:diacylglycerol/lipid kinase family protein [Cellulomonas fimi]|uniref:Diacylglycerol kinase catalytic region n=1 Tax=Cellulomonas fimi (strain ATCC 484 / DSM 20113 / JCM 1341 / CCUG 24087 / LMG 16345 / NBRC 15513 / NCIMB 8980 / NCTC 7547 / NRS-133) TaxID=590998 RepID=F4GZN7_CELFA|nr:diacylglycerol kinase family protein [Cellulomonas fimi]AEE46081.1 diacylglycerol kinase catalytic region [Cellulomonas fimi ATCC 484]NNH06932.1 diacylglycerol kinase family lipid kinase [Cellulomonas fimi]VEH31551.1 Diacylglycerol kinase [Cellulomonas fimi]